jgi:trehalose 6-phosphate phosphatase
VPQQLEFESALRELSLESAALFLDVDGTLLEIAPRPDAVTVTPGLIELLQGLRVRSGDALALVSGRTIATLDELFAQPSMPAAGMHGFERRDAFGIYHRGKAPSLSARGRVQRLMLQVADQHPSLLLEDKDFAWALHYRLAPEYEDEVIAGVLAIARMLETEIEVQRGKSVIELRPKGASKAGAVAQFMMEPPFRGRTPVYVGDDLTDEGAFEWVNRAGGLSIAVDVAHPTAASIRFHSVGEVRAWLQSLLRPTE